MRKNYKKTNIKILITTILCVFSFTFVNATSTQPGQSETQTQPQAGSNETDILSVIETIKNNINDKASNLKGYLNNILKTLNPQSNPSSSEQTQSSN